jgi:signal transduction histidine kinase
MSKGNILIIDDQQIHLKALSHYLNNLGFSVTSSNNGEEGCALAKLHKPDLVITDWEMPNMNGIEVIKHLRELDETKSIPIIMATGIMTTPNDLEVALKAGASDFIRKPFDIIELKPRLLAALQLYKSYQELQAYCQKLEEEHEERETMLGIVVHDLKSPFKKIKGLLQLMPMVGTLNEEQSNYIKMMDEVIKGGESLIRDLLDISQIEHHSSKRNITEIQLGRFINGFVRSYQQTAQKKGITLHLEVSYPELIFFSDENYLNRILDNMLTNALKFSPKNKNIYIKAFDIQGDIEFSIQDEGPGISEDDQQKMFRKFQRLSALPTAGENSTGLGLVIIKTLVERLDGKIEVSSELGQGTIFRVRFPLYYEVKS